MFIGHYGVALAAKRAAPRASLGALVLGAQFIDLVWPVLLLTGTERAVVRPGLMAASSLDFVHYPWTHSLLMTLVWGGVLGGLWWLLSKDGRTALVIGALVPSHWLLDLVVHRPDLPVWPGGPLVGLGLWHSAPGTLIAEFGLLALGMWLYLGATRARDRIGTIALWVFVVVLSGLWLGGTFGPPPPDVTTVAIGALVAWLMVPWAWWIDRHRTLRAAAAA